MEEIIDAPELKTGDVFYVKSGKLVGDTGVGFALVFAVAGALALPASGVLWLPALYMFFTTTGYQFDSVNNKIKYVIKHFGLFPSGKWKDNDTYKEIAIMGSRTTHAGGIFMGVAAVTVGKHRASNIHVELLDKYHVKRFAICEANTVEEAEKIAAVLSAKTGFPVVKFNPVRLTKTRRK